MNYIPIYWVSAIIQDSDTQKPWLCALGNGLPSVERAMEEIKFLRKNHTVLSAWIDIFTDTGEKRTLHHECLIDALGYVLHKPEDNAVW